MNSARRIGVEQRSQEWLDMRRDLVTATDLGAILGLSPWKSEWDVAQDKLGLAEPVEESLAMRKGSYLEPFILAEYQREQGCEAFAESGLWVSERIPWAACSPDAFASDPESTWLVELKHSGSRSRWADGLPKDYEAQVRWSLGVLGMSRCDVAAMVGDTLTVYTVLHDEAVFADLVAVASDFRRRLADGGPFSHSADSVKRAHPADDGTEAEADADTVEAVRALLDIRASIARLEDDAERLETAVKTRMADASVLTGDGFRVTWKRAKPAAKTDWRSVAGPLLESVPAERRLALIESCTTTTPGARRFLITAKGTAND